MKILAIIPARAGSKRLPNKNKLPLMGKPLIAWSIESARGIPEICDILVSTDDPEIVQISKIHGVMVPWLRPVELATDESHVVDTLIHAADWYEKNKSKIDGILLLQPTSPFRKKETIKNVLDIYIENGTDTSVVTVSKVKDHPDWCFQFGIDNLLIPMNQSGNFNKRSQELNPVYSLNGLAYIANPNKLRDTKIIVGEGTIGYLVENKMQTLDIDTEWDFKLAEFYCSSKPV